MNDDYIELLEKLRMYSDLLIVSGNSSQELLKPTIARVGLELLEVMESLRAYSNCIPE